jgi:mannosyltransferase OCH1-like enzyme
MTSIPLIIHQIWLDTKTDLNPHPPAKYLTEKYTIGIEKTNPEFEYRFWNMKAVKELFEDCRLQKWKNFYFNLDDWIEKCDFVRYAIMYIHGGIYIDCDFSAVTSLIGLIKDQKELMLVPHTSICGVKLREPGMTEPADVFNGILGSIPGHHFWPEFMDYIMYRYDGNTPVVNSTGPVALGNFTQLMYYSIDDRPEWYIDNRFVLWEEVKGPKDWTQYLCFNRFVGSWWQLSPNIIYKTCIQGLRGSTVTIVIWLIITLILLFFVLMYYPATQFGHQIEQQFRNSYNITTSSLKLWLYLSLSIFITGFVLLYIGFMSSNTNSDVRQVKQKERLIKTGAIVIIMSILLASRSILGPKSV